MFVIALSICVIQWEGCEVSPSSSCTCALSDLQLVLSVLLTLFVAFGELRCVSLFSTSATTCAQSVESSNSPAGLWQGFVVVVFFAGELFLFFIFVVIVVFFCHCYCLFWSCYAISLQCSHARGNCSSQVPLSSATVFWLLLQQKSLTSPFGPGNSYCLLQ